MPVDEPLYPINVRVKGHACIVVGGGRVALGKVLGLLEAGARVRVVAPEVIDDIYAIAGVEVERCAYRDGDVAGHRLVIAANGDPAVNEKVFDDGEAAGIFV